jgi:diaminopimelate epimerase
MKFHKYQALGNDYIVLETDVAIGVSPAVIRRICDRHYGVGSDGILIGASEGAGVYRLRIFNPDGSEAEKSGNGLRIFARFLWDHGRICENAFRVITQGGVVECLVQKDGAEITVDMGRASFASDAIPVLGPPREVIAEQLEVGGKKIPFTAVTIGNPHCVVHDAEICAELAMRLGPQLERHDLFPKRTNVQFVRVVNRNRIEIEIWERGAGYTLASGSSSCAAAAASVRLGLCANAVTVAMPGGELAINVSTDFDIKMTGPATKIAEGSLAAELLQSGPVRGTL